MMVHRPSEAIDVLKKLLYLIPPIPIPGLSFIDSILEQPLSREPRTYQESYDEGTTADPLIGRIPESDNESETS